MSGAQPKAAEIAGAAAIIAEVDESRIKTRMDQGWVSVKTGDIVRLPPFAGKISAIAES